MMLLQRSKVNFYLAKVAIRVVRDTFVEESKRSPRGIMEFSRLGPLPKAYI